MRYITGKFGCWLLGVGCWLLTACSSSSDETGEGAGSPLQILPYTASYHETDFGMRDVSARYNPFTPAGDIAVGLYVFPAETPTVKSISYHNGSWTSQVIVQGGDEYTLYGFMPKKDPISSSISKSGEVVTLTLSGLGVVNTDDVCFVTGVKGAEGDLLQGQFTYTGKTKDNTVRLLMDHLFAAVRFRFLVDADYSALRTIKLRSLALRTTQGTVTATITLTPNTEDTNPASVAYEPSGTPTTTSFFTSAEGVEIPTSDVEDVEFVGYIVPSSSSGLTLVTTYDVYDSNGNLVREDCTAENTLPDLNAKRGDKVTLELTVAPTYLYQLSDPDLDNPTITIGN